MIRSLKLIFPLMFLVVFLFSCNIFMPNSANRRDPEKYGEYSLLVEAKIKMRDEKWDEAADLFRKAISMNDSLSEAYFYLGKCILRINNVSIDQVWDEVNPDKDGADSMSVPFLYTPPEGISYNDPISPFTIDGIPDTARNKVDSVFLERKRIYDAISTALMLLDTITYNPERMDGVIKRKQYESDYLIEISVKAVLSIVDINNNDSLDFNNVEKRAFLVLCQDITSLDPDSMSFDSLKNISRDPKNINTNLDMILQSVNRADTSFDLFHNELVKGHEKLDDIDTSIGSGIGDIIDNFGGILPFFYYNDKADNDSDYYDTDGNGRKDRMIWIDWRGNGRIDIKDTADDGTIKIYTIGSDAHRKLRPEWYDTLASDTGDSPYHRYRYKGPHSYEFIWGDWGVDEEILDSKDNDGDGLVDEDTRIAADTLDDDGDHYDNDTSPASNDSGFQPMIWIDKNGDCSVSTGELIDKVGVYPTFILAHGNEYNDLSSLELPRHKYGGEFTGGDYGIDEEWFDGLDNDGDGLVDEDIGERLPPENLRQVIIDSLTSLREKSKD